MDVGDKGSQGRRCQEADAGHGEELGDAGVLACDGSELSFGVLDSLLQILNLDACVAENMFERLWKW